MNKVILVGRLTKDPDIRYTQTGKAIASFTLAVDRRVQSQKQQKTADFIPCIAWEKLAETCGNYLFKGHKILVEGRLQVRSYERQDGQRRWVTEVIITDIEFLEKKSTGQSNNSGENAPSNSFENDVFPDEEIPF